MFVHDAATIAISSCQGSDEDDIIQNVHIYYEDACRIYVLKRVRT